MLPSSKLLYAFHGIFRLDSLGGNIIAVNSHSCYVQGCPRHARMSHSSRIQPADGRLPLANCSSPPGPVLECVEANIDGNIPALVYRFRLREDCGDLTATVTDDALYKVGGVARAGSLSR